jgi:hypothetical protein
MKPLKNMKYYKADMHLHTALSPCGSLDMGPQNLVQHAVEAGLDMIAVTDHNSGRQCRSVARVASDRGLYVLCGVEVNTREEVHCLAYFPSFRELDAFDRLLYEQLADIPNDPDKFGYQVVVDHQEQIVDYPQKLLISSVDMGVEEVEQAVHRLGGLFVPAHIDRLRNGIIAQLGFIPPGLKCDALEISPHSNVETLIREHPYLQGHAFMRGSDAHYPEDIGSGGTRFQLDRLSWSEICMALEGTGERKMELL